MIRSFTAFTSEIDDVELAVSEVLAQLDLENKLLRNTVGILTCYAEFIESGVVAALCESLPFEVLGTTTIANAARDSLGEMSLAIMVLTSDDVSFTICLTDSILGEDEAPLRASYEAAVANQTGKPALMVSFAPLLLNVSGDFYVSAMTVISGGVPNFGTLAVDHNQDYHDSHVIVNGEAWKDRYAFMLIYGDIHPTFYIATISDEKIFPEKGAVTASQGNQLQTVNGISVIDYLQSLGLAKNDDGTITGINSFPFIMDYNDGTPPVVRVMFALTPEGYAVCGGDIPVGATLSVGAISTEEVIASTKAALEKTLGAGRPDVALLFSCIGRYFAQGFDPTAEMEAVIDRFRGTEIPYLLTYSGSELCPVYSGDGKTTNRNHNDTFIICVF